MAYHINHLETIVRTARMARDYGNMTNEAAIDFALSELADTCRDALKRTNGFQAHMSHETMEGWRELSGVVADVQRGFVSPTLGSVRGYVRVHLAD